MKPSKHFANNVKKLKDTLNSAINEGVAEMTQEIANRTPVDKYQMVGNWQYVLDPKDAKFIKNPSDRSRMLSYMNVKSAGYKIKPLETKITYVISGVDYAHLIEQGYSGQSPQGVVRFYSGVYANTLETTANAKMKEF